MRRSYLENKYLKKKTDQYLRAYKKQKNYCSRLYKKERKKFFNGLNPSFVTDNKLFWKTVKPFFSNKGNYGANIKLVEGEVWQNGSKIAEKLNQFFKNAVSTLGITENSFVINEEYKNISDPVQRAIVKFESHPSISLIKNKITNGNNFKFEPVSLSDIELEITKIKF